MDIAFRTRRLERTFNAARALQKTYGPRMVKAIMLRMAVLRAAANLEAVRTTPPERRHQLTGDGDEQFAVDLVHPQRLVFKVGHEPVPRRDDGGVDTERVTAVTVMDVVDYH